MEPTVGQNRDDILMSSGSPQIFDNFGFVFKDRFGIIIDTNEFSGERLFDVKPAKDRGILRLSSSHATAC
jgi:hypothetical protein